MAKINLTAFHNQARFMKDVRQGEKVNELNKLTNYVYRIPKY